MKVQTIWWGEVEARYHRDDRGMEWLLCPAVPWGYLLPRDLVAEGRWSLVLSKACEAAVKEMEQPVAASAGLPFIADAPAVPEKRRPGRPRKVREDGA